MGLLAENRQSLRAGAQASSFSADRFGLLAAGSIAEVIPIVVAESAGEFGLKKLAEDPASTIKRIERAHELMRFALSAEYLAVRRKLS